MKAKLFSSLIISLIFSLNFYAQDQGFSYKAIVSDAGSVLQNQEINVRFTILENGTTQVYQETHLTTTDDNGIIIVTIGEGDTSDDFSSIDWATTEFLKVEFNTGSGYVDMGTTEFKAVPFAKYANYADTAEYVNHSFWNQISNGITSADPVGIGVPATLEANFHINAVMNSEPLLKMESNDNVYTIWESNRAGTDDFLIGIDGGNNRFIFANTTTGAYPLTLKNDKVGINNLNPSAQLDVNGTFKLADGTEGTGKVLTSDASGNASWATATPSVQTYTKNISPISAQRATDDFGFVRGVLEFYFTTSTSSQIFVPLDLPANATLTEITYYYYDNDNTNDLSFALYFSNISDGSNQVYADTMFTSSGASSTVQSEVLNVSYTIHDIYNFGFIIYPSSSWPGDSTLSFRGVKITYTM